MISALPALTAPPTIKPIVHVPCPLTSVGVVAGYAGLLVSFHTGVASGPAIILVAGALYVVSLLFGRVGGLVRQAFPGRHLEA